ncbi:HAAS signaling domain-containing protein [Actinoplanes sp. G11-F43]|uniref:HAAS signaling domain-containing protein n=1 Tax=Actinoplanes sp. G11-F43 TaxID=3424130 RepID=UPI003D354EE5
MMMTESDHLVEIYLARVDQAAMRLPAARREELVSDLREHIAIARAETEEETEASIRTILERLGDPESIVAAADTQTDLPRMPPAPAWAPAPVPAPRRSGLRPGWIVAIAVAVAGVLAFCFLALALARGDSGAEIAPMPAEPAQTELPTSEPS